MNWAKEEIQNKMTKKSGMRVRFRSQKYASPAMPMKSVGTMYRKLCVQTCGYPKQNAIPLNITRA